MPGVPGLITACLCHGPLGLAESVASTSELPIAHFMIFLGSFSQVLTLSTSFLCPILSYSKCAYPSDPLPHAIIEQDQWTSESFSKPRVALPHENPTKSFWTHGSVDANPLAKEGSEGTLAADADVVIIGSGITGVGTAFHLSEAVATTDIRLKIVILEARDFCENRP